jgi:hypothetical protein
VKVCLDDGREVFLCTGLSANELERLRRQATSSYEFMYYGACLRYVRSTTDLDRRVWLHVARELRRFLGRLGWEGSNLKGGVDIVGGAG